MTTLNPTTGGLMALNDATRSAQPVQGSLPPSMVPSAISQPARQLSANIENGGFTQGGQQSIDQMTQELFNLDQQLEGQYKSPFPQTEGYVENPNDVLGALGNYAGGLSSNIGAANQVLGETQASYDRVVGQVLDRFMNFYQMQQAQEQARKDQEYEKKKDQLDFELQMAKLTGGTVTNPFTGEKIQVPGPSDSSAYVTPEQSSLYGLGVGTPWTEYQGNILKELAGTDKKTKQELQSIDMIDNLIDQVDKEYKDVSSLSRGPVFGNLTENFRQYQPQAREYEQYVNSIASVLARNLFSESGTLNEGDVQRAKDSMPNLQDDAQTAMNKIARLKNMLAFKSSQLTGGPYTTTMPETPKGFFASIGGMATSPAYAGPKTYKVDEFTVTEK